MFCNHTGNICSSDFTIVGEVRHTWWSSPLWLTCKETGLHSSLRPIQYLTLCIVCMASAQTENVGEGRKAINDGHTLSKKDNGLTRMERNGPLCLSPGLFWNQNDWWVVHQEWRAFHTWLTFQSPYESNADDSHRHPSHSFGGRTLRRVLCRGHGENRILLGEPGSAIIPAWQLCHTDKCNMSHQGSSAGAFGRSSNLIRPNLLQRGLQVLCHRTSFFFRKLKKNSTGMCDICQTFFHPVFNAETWCLQQILSD